jgi:hypothetical protein
MGDGGGGGSEFNQKEIKRWRPRRRSSLKGSGHQMDIFLKAYIIKSGLSGFEISRLPA